MSVLSLPRGVTLTLALWLGAAFSARLTAQTAAGGPPTQTPQIVVGGMGEARVTPDRAAIFIGVQSRAATAATAAADNGRRQRAVLDTLRALGLPSDQLSTTNYNVSPEMQYPPNAPPRVTGYTVTNTVRVDVLKLDEVARYIDASLAKGANDISGLQFFSSKADSARRMALSAAISSARADAESMARAAGGSLGALLELSTESAPASRFEMAMARVASAPMPTPIDPGVQMISANVTARWAFIAR